MSEAAEKAKKISTNLRSASRKIRELMDLLEETAVLAREDPGVSDIGKQINAANLRDIRSVVKIAVAPLIYREANDWQGYAESRE